MNLLTNEPLLCSFILNEEDSDATKRVFHGAQSNVYCMVSVAVMAKEKEAMESNSFKSLLNFVKKVEREGLPANGDEPAIPRQKDGLVGCGDLAFHQKTSDLGGACKVKTFCCTYCSTMSGDHDLLSYVSGSLVCDMCKRNGREFCAHVHVDDEKELTRKGRELVALLLKDKRRRTCNASLTVQDMLPSDPVDCFLGYNEEHEKVMEKVSICKLVSPDGLVFERTHLYDYSRHLIHTEESDVVLKKSIVKFDPNAVNKNVNTNNIEYVCGENNERDDAFAMNVMKDLLLRGYNSSDLPRDSAVRQSMLLACLMT